MSLLQKTILFPSRQSARLLYIVSRDRLSEILNAYASYLLFHKPLTFNHHLRVGVHLMQQKWMNTRANIHINIDREAAIPRLTYLTARSKLPFNLHFRILLHFKKNRNLYMYTFLCSKFQWRATDRWQVLSKVFFILIACQNEPQTRSMKY